MAIQRCKNGHYYNDSESATCPYCSGESSIGKTIPLDTDYQNSGLDRTENLKDAPNGMPGEFTPTKEPEGDTKFGQTVMLDNDKNSEIKPVRGWLVVIEGEKRGLDFRIHTGKNSVGRSRSNDISIEFDNAISQTKACFVIYDEKNNAFHLMSGESTNNIYVNSDILLMPRKLEDNDIIEIGQSKLVFRSLCNDKFSY